MQYSCCQTRMLHNILTVMLTLCCWLNSFFGEQAAFCLLQGHVCSSHIMCVYRYATSNTRSGIESCGILAGSLREKQGVFVISTLIIPKQEGTSDTVQALNEEEIFDVQDKRALYPLGWIHTHPTQTCFLSSVDVHTQCGYQVGSCS